MNRPPEVAMPAGPVVDAAASPPGRDTDPIGDDGGEASRLAHALAAAQLDWLLPAWPVPGRVGALTTTRSGGVGTGGAESFLPAPPVWLRQVHGTAVAVLGTAHRGEALAEPPVADAAVTADAGVVCAVRTADCLPVVFADRRGGCVGVAHAGWRGLAAGVLPATIAALEQLGAPASRLTAWLGPAIGPHAFEVGDDVLEAFTTVDAAHVGCFVAHPERPGKWLADLYGLARRILAAAGIGEVHGGSHCTFTEVERFYSYRRDQATGRMATLVWLRPEPPRPGL